MWAGSLSCCMMPLIWTSLACNRLQLYCRKSNCWRWGYFWKSFDWCRLAPMRTIGCMFYSHSKLGPMFCWHALRMRSISWQLYRHLFEQRCNCRTRPANLSEFANYFVEYQCWSSVMIDWWYLSQDIGLQFGWWISCFSGDNRGAQCWNSQYYRRHLSWVCTFAHCSKRIACSWSRVGFLNLQMFYRSRQTIFPAERRAGAKQHTEGRLQRG